METARRGLVATGSASVSASTSRFPGIGGPPSSRHHDESSRPTADDARHFERWKESVRAQDEEQTLLHQTVVASKRQQLELQQERLAKQRAFIRHEKRKILLQNALLESENERFEASLASDWFCRKAFPTAHDRRVTLDVGGQLFEISSSYLRKDPLSMLAALVADDSPLATLECGCFRVDRDWWLFRYVLHFLRDGMLPPDPKLLRALYLESEFYQLDSMRRAIEKRNMELLQLQQSNNETKTKTKSAAATLFQKHSGSNAKHHLGSGIIAKMKAASMVSDHAQGTGDAHAWWLEAPTWWGDGNKASDEPKLKPKLLSLAMKRAQLKTLEEENKDKKEEVDTWWKASTYKGKEFAPPLEKPTDDSGTPRSPLFLSSTWTSIH